MTPSRTCSVDLTCDLTAPRAARRLLSLLLPQWGVTDQEVLDSATIVVSELVTNVLVHCDDAGPLTLTLELLDGVVRLAVADREPGLPTQRQAQATDVGGRGLSIVAQMALTWSVEPSPGGKRVVVDLPAPSSAWV